MRDLKKRAKNTLWYTLPAAPDEGPPLPHEVFISWPLSMKAKMPKPVVRLSDWYRKVLSKSVGLLPEY